jgi:type IVB pilus formation R64 PilN family outer membrane protein
MKKTNTSILFISFCLTLTGCSNIVYNEKQKEVQKKVSELTRQVHIDSEKRKAKNGFEYSEETYIGGGSRVARSESFPQAFSKRHNISDLRPLSLKQMVDRINLISPYTIKPEAEVFVQMEASRSSVASGISQGSKTFLGTLVQGGQVVNFTGSLKELLDLVASSNGIHWKFKNNNIVLYKLVTKTFPIRSLPASVAIENELASDSESDGGGVNTQKTTANLEETEFWSDIEEAIAIVLTSEGKIKVIPSVNRVTVSDTPEAIERVSEVVKNYNDGLSRQVIVDVQVVDVNMFNEFKTGVNWDLLYQSTSSQLLQLQGIIPSVSTDNNGLFTVSVPSTSSNKSAGSKAVVDALREQGQISFTAKSTVIALNNRPSPVSIGRSRGFLEKVETTTTANVGSTTSLTQNTLNTGFNMNILPTVLDGGDILLQYSISIKSQNGDFDEVAAGGSTIQLPDVNFRSFMNSMSLRSGDTVLIPGFEQTATTQTQSGGVGGIGKDDSNNRTKIFLLITATSLKV